MLNIQPIGQSRHVRVCLSGRVLHSQLPYLDELIRIASDTRCAVLLDLGQVSVLDLATVRYRRPEDCCHSRVHPRLSGSNKALNGVDSKYVFVIDEHRLA